VIIYLEWEMTFYDIKKSKRNEESKKLYKPLDIDLDEKLKVNYNDGKGKVANPQILIVKIYNT
jgi:uncharacterized protein YaaW (UPF0174 family)